MTPTKVTSGCGNSYERRTSAFAQLALAGTASVCLHWQLWNHYFLDQATR